jgi:hypothetical protein
MRVLLLTLFALTSLYAYEVSIPLKEMKLPAQDLNFNGRSISPEEVLKLHERGVNIAQMNPHESEIWSDEKGSLAPEVENEMDLDFTGTMLSYTGLMRFNALKRDENSYHIVLMHRELHTILLRKNLLKKLGYKIPEIKYVKKLNLTFSSLEEKNNLIGDGKAIVNNTYGASSRWLVNDDDKDNDKLTVSLYDVAVMTPSQRDHYNVALGVPVGNPPRPLEDRVLRALAVPYALADLKESVNKFKWSVGRIDNEHITLEHFAYGLLNTGLEDAYWILNRLAKLDRYDFVDIVKKSYFPESVEKLIVEKLIARRNSLITLFELDHDKLDVNAEISHGEELVKGKLTRETWEGYATRFSHGDTESPFKDFEYFIFNKLQKTGIDELMLRVNAELSAFNPTDQKIAFHQDQFEKGLNHFIETGELLEFGVGYWTSPVLDGTLILSRDIVVGNYFGTDNLVQMADTFGYAATAGVHIGFENVPTLVNVHSKATGSFIRTFSHLRPVQSLKKTFEEPYRNMIVPLIKKDLKESLDKLASMPAYEDQEEDQRDVTKEIVRSVNESLSVGESLIITDKIVPSVSAGAGVYFGETGVSFGLNAKKDFVRRMQIYRKSSDIVQVYVDKGKAFELSFQLNVSYHIPILNVNAKRRKGEYETNLYNLNINPEQGDIVAVGRSLHDLLENNSTELLDEVTDHYEFKASFLDKSFRFRFLFLYDKSISNSTDLLFKDHRDREYRFLDLKFSKVSGFNYQAFVTDLLNFYIKKHFEDFEGALNNNADKNPGQTIHGSSKTKLASFEGRVPMDHNVIEHPFVRLTTRYQGWSTGVRRIKRKTNEIKRDFRRELFSDEMIEGLGGLQLYEITSHMNIYEEGVRKLISLKENDLKVIGSDCRQSSGNDDNQQECKSIVQFRKCNQVARVKRDGKWMIVKGEKYLQCMMKFLTMYNEDTPAHKIIELVGSENVFVHATINGFRKNSEILNEPIRSHTIGNIHGGRYWNGPVSTLLEKIGMQSGEFYGSWLRELQ